MAGDAVTASAAHGTDVAPVEAGEQAGGIRSLLGEYDETEESREGHGGDGE